MSYFTELWLWLAGGSWNLSGLSGLGLIFVIFYLAHRQAIRTREAFRLWALQNEYTVIKREERFFFRGGFLPFTEKGPVVFKFEILDKEGKYRSGFANISMNPLLAPRDIAAGVAARWDEPTAPAQRDTPPPN